MSPISVLVAATSPDIKAEGISVAVERRDDMVLAENRVVSLFEVDALLRVMSPMTACALILVGKRSDAQRLESRWLVEKRRLVILHLDVVDDLTRIALRDPDLQSLLNALSDLSGRDDATDEDRIVIVHADVDTALERTAGSEASAPSAVLLSPLWLATHEWLRLLLGDAADAIANRQGGTLGFTVTSEAIGDILKDTTAVAPTLDPSDDLRAAEQALADAIERAPTDGTDRLASLLRLFDLALERRLVLLALAPEFDVRFQRCIGLLLDDATRRVPSMSLCMALLGEQARGRAELGRSGDLARWWVFAGQRGALPQADDPVRLAPPLANWLFGAREPFVHEPELLRVRRAAWAGASVVDAPESVAASAAAIRRACRHDAGHVDMFDAGAFADWAALLERGAKAANTTPLRIDGARLAALDPGEVRATCMALAWHSHLQVRPLFLDTRGSEVGAQGDDALRAAVRVLCGLCCRIGWLTDDVPRCIRLLDGLPHSLVVPPVAAGEFRQRVVQAAARTAGVTLDREVVRTMADTMPLHAAGFENATRLVRAVLVPGEPEDERLKRWLAACQDVASEGASGLATSLAPAFALEDVVLPPECEAQLREIVDSVRLAPQVLDTWKFRERLPYGRGIAALFQGPSGTGKTMSALGVAHALSTRVLRLDLSRVVSKYIGDTEKNIDRVFDDAKHSGAVIVIDEADALLGKRSEVKDAHDRYANIEVAYLLQRIETHDGLAIFTTNLRQNLDPAFLRRLRFIIDFPRPDALAREEIWRRCLPPESHEVSEPEFHQLGRKIDLTGGHIRQITLRAAFIAAAARRKIGLEHIARASRAELAKLGLPPVELALLPRREAA